MPYDQKRINGPENSFSYNQFVKNLKEEPKAIEGKREDGRKNDEHRKLGNIRAAANLIISK